MGNEQDLLQKRFIDLSKQANRKGIVIYSDFLNLSEQNLLSVLLSAGNGTVLVVLAVRRTRICGKKDRGILAGRFRL